MLNLGTKCTWELDQAAPEGQDQDNVINVVTNEGDLCINEDMTFDYVHAYPQSSTPWTTSVSSTNLWVPIKALSLLSTPLQSSLLAKHCVTNGYGVFILVLEKKPNQKAIFFGRAKDSLACLEDSKDQGELPDFFAYNPTAYWMMKHLGYDFEWKIWLNLEKWRRTVPLAIVPKGKYVEYSHKTKRGLR